MPQPAARANVDTVIGICPAHDAPIVVTGFVSPGSPNVLTNMMPAARMGDQVIGSCGHTAIVIMASATVRANFMGKARLGDQVAGVWNGTILGGSPNVLVGG